MIIVYVYVVGDILHYGHLRHLLNAKALGDKLIVGVLTDEAVMEKKPRPVIPFAERLALISALECVDVVIPQETYAPHDNVKMVGADILMESTSHSEKLRVHGESLMKALGGRMVVTPYYQGQSSTSIKRKIKEAEMEVKIRETKLRSGVKSIIWRITGVFILALITYIFTRSWIQTGLITVFHHGIFLIVFYFHERIWLKIPVVNMFRRSLLKMFTYETLCGNIILGTITYCVTGNFVVMTSITLTYIGIKHVCYVFNEYIWRKE